MDTREAGRKGGLSKSAAKQASSRKNIACARRTVKQALVAYKSAVQPSPETAPVPAVIAPSKTVHIFYGKPKGENQ
jgi:hypothetical protein